MGIGFLVGAAVCTGFLIAPAGAPTLAIQQRPRLRPARADSAGCRRSTRLA